MATKYFLQRNNRNRNYCKIFALSCALNQISVVSAPDKGFTWIVVNISPQKYCCDPALELSCKENYSHRENCEIVRMRGYKVTRYAFVEK